jgi:phosphatidate phosphatase
MQFLNPINLRNMQRPNNQQLNEDEEKDRNSTKKRITQIIIDYTIIIIIFILFGIVYNLKPKITSFFCYDNNILYPYKADTIPFYAVAIYATLAPILIFIIVEMFNFKLLPFQRSYYAARKKKFIICVINAVTLFALGIGITLLLTEISKKWMGTLRPSFIAVCNPDLTKLNCSINGSIPNYIYTGDGFCRGNPYIVEKARLAFPSGHASYSAYTMIFLIIYLQIRLVLYRLRFLKALLQLAAFIAAFLTSLSRITDNKHTVGEVTAGALLGIVIACYITHMLGKVLWYYDKKIDFYDFDLKNTYDQ